MKLRDLLANLSPELLNAPVIPDWSALDQEVKGLCTNSHACQPGEVFIGMPGTRVDGGEFWAGALDAGAIAALVSPYALRKRPPADPSTPLMAINDMPTACGDMAAAFYGYPGHHLDLIGVTGTNGKTTTTHLIEFLLQAVGQAPALLGTLYSRWPGHQQVAQHTTPFAVELQRELAAALQAGAQQAVMEVSSHALAQKRVRGCRFKAAIFTNLTQDHLDYHRDLDDYFNAKALLFSPDYLAGRAIVNAADEFGQRLLGQLNREQIWRYSVDGTDADFYTSSLSYGATGVSGQLHTPLGEAAFSSPLVGQFNLENLLAAVGAVLALGADLESVVAALPDFPGVPGRMEQVKITPEQDISVIVDYAHTPDSLKNALKAARPFISGRLICVFGCGGDRDSTKRPQMGRIAHELADRVIVTSDNPRTEDPEKILADILAGIPSPLAANQVMCDRTAAIQQAIAVAQPGDGVLIAGKGHEDYQILGTEKIHFDDREQARAALAKRYPVGQSTFMNSLSKQG